MRVQVDFIVNKDVDFYTPLNQAMTAFIYRCISLANKKYSKKLHDGYVNLGHKKFVFHSYSLSQNKKIIDFKLKKGIGTLIFSSAISETVIYFIKGLIKIGNIQLFGYSFNIHEIKQLNEPEISDTEILNILSPVYATDNKGQWLGVNEMEVKLGENLIEKYYALYKKLPENIDVKIKILSHKAEYIKYKKDTFRGYTGLIAMEGDIELIRLAYNAGLGARCGQGMGLLSYMH